MPRGTVTPPANWASNWGSGVQAKSQKWAQNLIAHGPAMFTKAAASVAHWQAQVASPSAASKYVGKLKEVNFQSYTTTVNGAGLQKFASAGVNKQHNYAHFANTFHPKLQSMLQALPARGARGDPANRARLNQLLDAMQATRGKNF